MEFIDITETQKNEYNEAVSHPLQSFEWGQFREKTGIKVVRRGQHDGKKMVNAYTMTLHKVPKLPYFIGYIPKSTLPDQEMIADIASEAKKNNCVYVQLEPDVLASHIQGKISKSLRPSFHPLFTKYTFVLDITPDEETLLSHMHPKTRYNIRVAIKHNVKIVEDNSEKGFEDFMKLYEETTIRQKFYAHTPNYHKKLWEMFQKSKIEDPRSKNELQYHLLHARLDKTTLTSWVLFSFHDKLYYPYGASSRENRETMSSNLIMWEAIRFGKKQKLKEFDMWGALGPEPDAKDPWYGFHKFKQGYGAQLSEFAGSYDLVINPALYELVKIGDKLRWGLLKLKKKI
ncbi:MAG: lipid II:glycine glycyltransferase FemX [Candidatus Levyibacteriota bacterium]